MIVNGLIDPTLGANVQQNVHLTFNFAGTRINSLQRLNRSTGIVEVVPLVSDGGSSYHLDLVLSGGSGDMLKFNTGAPFLTSQATPTPNLVSAASVQSHAGTAYALPLAITGEAGVECRTINGSLQIVLTFDQNITSAHAEVADGTGTVQDTPTFSGKTMTVNLTGVTDAQTIALAVSNLNGMGGLKALSVGVLCGDVNGDGAVNSQDLVAVRNAVGTESAYPNFNPAPDINKDGAVNSQDLVQVRNRVGDELP